MGLLRCWGRKNAQFFWAKIGKGRWRKTWGLGGRLELVGWCWIRVGDSVFKFSTSLHKEASALEPTDLCTSPLIKWRRNVGSEAGNTYMLRTWPSSAPGSLAATHSINCSAGAAPAVWCLGGVGGGGSPWGLLGKTFVNCLRSGLKIAHTGFQPGGKLLSYTLNISEW